MQRGFGIGFRVEVDPEFDGEGAEAPQRIPADLPRIGAVLRLTPPDAEPWLIAIGAPNWWRTPVVTAVAFISDFIGYVVDVVDRRVLIERPGVIRVWEAQESNLLLLVGHTDIAAFGAGGVAWQTPPLVRDDLKVIASDPVRITCRGRDDVDTFVEFALDPATGERLG